MEKLIELFKEYRKEKGERNLNEFEVSQPLDSLNYLRLFIKWLVENEKIDYEKVRSGEGNGSRWHFETVQPEYYIIMLLSIQDEPIEFLISILK